MSLTEKGYKKRLIDEKLRRYLKVFGAVQICGPKWCGKTWTSLNQADSVVYLTDHAKRDLAAIDPKSIFSADRPQLLDEWQLVPVLWDAVRHECDRSQSKGNFILTGSTTPFKNDGKNEVFHSGAGRIASLNMYPMSLFESGDSSGAVSIRDMLANKEVSGKPKPVELLDLAKMAVRGGWPENQTVADEDIGLIPESYVRAVVEKDMNARQDRQRDTEKMFMLLRSLARNESTTASNDTLVRDIEAHESGNNLIASRQTIADYLSVLSDLFIFSNQPAFSVNYRSSNRIGKTKKRHFVDPSLVCACLGLSPEQLLEDIRTFGFVFESLATRDLKIYLDFLDGNLRYFRDNISGDEVDAILEFKDGSYGAAEIKLSYNGIEDAKTSLMNFYQHVAKKPKFMCIIVGYLDTIVRDPATGIYIVPLTGLKP